MKHVNPSLMNAPQKMKLKNTMNKLLLSTFLPNHLLVKWLQFLIINLISLQIYDTISAENSPSLTKRTAHLRHSLII